MTNKAKVKGLISVEIKDLNETYNSINLYNKSRKAILPKILNLTLDTNSRLDSLLKYSVIALGIIGVVGIIEIVRTIIFLRGY